MAFKSEQLEAIEKAIASGTLRVRWGDPVREKEYRSIDQLIKARDLIRSELGKKRSIRVRTVSYRETR